MFYALLIWPKKNLWIYPPGSIWVTEATFDLNLRLYVIVYAVPAGHRGAAAMKQALKKSLKCSTLQTDVRAFICACINRLSTVRWKKIPRPFGSAIHETS